MLANRHVCFLLVTLVTHLGCRTNPKYCEDHVGNNCDAPLDVVDGQQGCVTNEQCTSPTEPVCDTSKGVCVQCTPDQATACTGATTACSASNVCVQCTADQATACPAATPVCSASNVCIQCTPEQSAACAGATPVCGANNQCQKCTAHMQCRSAVCLADGSCAGQGDVAYVAPFPGGSDNAVCTKATPCISVARALQLQPRRPYIKLSGKTDEAVLIEDQDVTLVGDSNAQLTSTMNGLLLEVRGSSRVEIYDLTITGASGTNGIGISMPAGSTGSLTIARSTISNNQAGGIAIMGGSFAIVGNMFFQNGGSGSNIGGIAIGTGQSAMNRLEFNSFSRNLAQDGLGAAIHCVAGTFTARNNVMSGNGTLSNQEQVGGTCKHAYSIARPGMVPSGMNNTGSDPVFVDAAQGNLHIQAGSPARGAADPSSELTGIASHDIDGDPRSPPVDIGADQVR
jgi:hypothetical protein